ncbi:hypothetical protein RhiXN_04214 [Rhizoctonia solani]|uniref:Uncharacterized protein n=1 Tax=Rhizoctonia solani TaxID=456999 RepID=A0A8H8STM4_9AGAM|nr:uncharacterized protein RhiXN_04214 [Rhizoctonia solani]QRW16213.1 hypothetical protein RhiXN_04214 [Rhizoctonia solani]
MVLRSSSTLRATARQFCTGISRRHKASSGTSVDDLPVPLQATWSVGELLSTYPAPELSDETFARLHRLSALNAPGSTSSDKNTMKLELQELLRLVEAVKLVDTSSLDGVNQQELLDSRIWAEGQGIDFDAPAANHLSEVHGDDLLKHAKTHVDGQYMVETAARVARGAKGR